MNETLPITLSNRLFWAMGILKICAIAFAVMMFADGTKGFNAHAAGASCGGNNLLEALKETDSTAYERVLEASEKTLNGKGLLWKIEKEGVEPSFLYGTMHMADPRIATFPPKLQSVIDQVETIAVENTEALDTEKAQAAMVNFQHLTLNLDNLKLEAELPKDLIDALKSTMAARGIPDHLMNLFQPWVVSAMVAVPVCETELKATGALVLDGMIAKAATDNDKELVSLETLEEQFTAISTIPREFHITTMKEMLTLGSAKLDDFNETMKQLYLSEQVSVFMPLARELTPESFKAKGSAEFQELLIDRRNAVMAKRSEALLTKGNTLIAVGALHLPGPTGLVEHFKELGYKVSRVN